MQQHKVPMSKKKFRIGELAKELDVKKFVVRFWEKEFGLKSERSEGGQRFYTEDDLKTFNTIKFLLYSQGFTIAGAKTKLQETLHSKNQVRTESAVPNNTITAATKIVTVDRAQKDEFVEKLYLIKGKLTKIRQLLG
jgi:DNA-binding transcriptional MerR regulator